MRSAGYNIIDIIVLKSASEGVMPRESIISDECEKIRIERVFSLSHCVFCQRLAEEVITENDLAAVMIDNYPVSPGHVLVVPKRHVETFFEATLEEINAITQLIFGMKEQLDEQYHPAGYNIGTNVGKAAGQGIFHLHMHVIPRYTGDVSDPRGGIRRLTLG